MQGPVCVLSAKLVPRGSFFIKISGEYTVMLVAEVFPEMVGLGRRYTVKSEKGNIKLNERNHVEKILLGQPEGRRGNSSILQKAMRINDE